MAAKRTRSPAEVYVNRKYRQTLVHTSFFPSHLQEKATKADRNHRDSFRQKAKNFFVQDDVLYRHVPGAPKGLEVIKKGREKLILAEFHGGPYGGHSGVNKTIDAIKARYWWKGLTEDVKSYVKSCEKCQKSDPLKPPQKPDLHPIKVSHAFELVGIDLVGPLVETDRGNKYIFTATDYFTKWVEAFPIRAKSAEEVSKCILELFTRHGAMNAILTDQGREFINQVNKGLCDAWNVKHKMTAAYHPQTNGLDERTNQTVKTALRKMTNERQTDWDLHLNGVLFSLRTKPHASTKYSPFFLLYGREAVYPSQLPNDFIAKGLPEEATEEDFANYTDSRQEADEATNTHVKSNINKAQQRQKKQYDAKVKGRPYEEICVGDTVLLHNSRKAATKSKGNLQPNYDGPYRVVSIKKKSATLENMKGQTLKKKYNIDRLKLFKRTETTQDSNGDQDSSKNKTPEQKQTSEEKKGDAQESSSTSHAGQKASTMGPNPKQTREEMFIDDVSFKTVLHDVRKLDIKTLTDLTSEANLTETDPILSFMAEVSRAYSAELDRMKKAVIPKLLIVDESLAEQPSVGFLMATLFTKAMMLGLEVVDIVDTLLPRPSHLRVLGDTSTNLDEHQRLTIGGETLDTADLATLEGRRWLNDKVINAYLCMLKTHSNIESTKIFVLPSYTAVLWENGRFDHYLFKKVKMSLYSKILLPINIGGNHWALMVADIKVRTVSVLDSMEGSTHQQFFNYWRNFMSLREEQVPEGLDQWTYIDTPSSKQTDGNSCGVFVLMNAECITKDVHPSVMRQVHTGLYRRYARRCLFEEGKTKADGTCDYLDCQGRRGHQRWVQCAVCGRWMHTRCCNISTRAAIIEEFECIYCKAMYN